MSLDQLLNELISILAGITGASSLRNGLDEINKTFVSIEEKVIDCAPIYSLFASIQGTLDVLPNQADTSDSSIRKTIDAFIAILEIILTSNLAGKVCPNISFSSALRPAAISKKSGDPPSYPPGDPPNINQVITILAQITAIFNDPTNFNDVNIDATTQQLLLLYSQLLQALTGAPTPPPPPPPPPPITINLPITNVNHNIVRDTNAQAQMQQQQQMSLFRRFYRKNKCFRRRCKRNGFHPWWW